MTYLQDRKKENPLLLEMSAQHLLMKDLFYIKYITILND